MVTLVSFKLQHCLIPFTFCLSKGPLKLDFLDIYLKTFLAIRNFGNTSAMRVIVLFQSVQNFMYISKMQKKIGEKGYWFLDNCL